MKSGNSSTNEKFTGNKTFSERMSSTEEDNKKETEEQNTSISTANSVSKSKTV